MQSLETRADRIERAMCLLERSRQTVEKTRANLLRARAITIRAHSLAQVAKSTLYENHLIRRLKR